MNTRTEAEILVIEDNPGDVDLIIEGLRGSKIANHISVAVDGVEALEFLRKQGIHASAPTPDLVLLDLNLPRKDGRELLAEIKQDPELAQIPVVVMTSSTAERDLLQAYQLRCNAYVTKPIDLTQFLSVVSAIDYFWLQVVKLPRVVPR
jgi:CheY-like chemotaxis protein